MTERGSLWNRLEEALYKPSTRRELLNFLPVVAQVLAGATIASGYLRSLVEAATSKDLSYIPQQSSLRDR